MSIIPSEYHSPSECRKVDAETFALGWDMTVPMTESDLAGRTLSEVRAINETLARRAAEVMAENLMLSVKDMTAWRRANIEALATRCEGRDEDGVSRFLWTGENGHSQNYFTPGKWWQAELEELEDLRERAAMHKQEYEPKERARIVSRLTGAV